MTYLILFVLAAAILASLLLAFVVRASWAFTLFLLLLLVLMLWLVTGNL